VVDLHTHLLPAVDDGARDLAGAAAVLARFATDGVTIVACTPHLRASAVRRRAPRRHDASLAELQAAAPAGMTLVHGWEVMLDEPGVDLTDAALRLGGAPAVLVEFPRGPGVPPNARAELERICHSGVVPVVAHPERYPGCTVAEIARWRAAGAVSQGTAVTLAATGRRGDAARALLAAGALDVLASDNHGDGRSLAAARALLDAHGAGDVAALLTAENPSRVLRGERPLPVPPLTVRAGVWARLARYVRSAVRAPARGSATT
jgi:protein-tyrosine phosphatase